MAILLFYLFAVVISILFGYLLRSGFFTKKMQEQVFSACILLCSALFYASMMYAVLSSTCFGVQSSSSFHVVVMSVFMFIAKILLIFECDLSSNIIMGKVILMVLLFLILAMLIYCFYLIFKWGVYKAFGEGALSVFIFHLIFSISMLMFLTVSIASFLL